MARAAENGSTHGGSFGILDDIVGMAGSVINNRKHNAAAKLAELADSLRNVAESVPDIAMFKDYADIIAHNVESLADYVTESDFDTILSDVGEFMRKHPAVAIAGSVTGGLVLGHIVKGAISDALVDDEISTSSKKPKTRKRKS